MSDPLSRLIKSAEKHAGGKGDRREFRRAPVHLWNPDLCANVRMRIDGRGTWYYQNSPIGRERMTRLFSTVLTCRDSEYYLVTPGEKIAVDVEDLPFFTRGFSESDGGLAFVLDSSEVVTASEAHPIRVDVTESGEPRPRIQVHEQLWARIARSDYYQLVAIAEEARGELWVESSNARFSLGSLTG